MNIFILDKDIVECARAHCNKHVVKMILESAQIMCTVAHKLGLQRDRIPYRKTHENHPCVLWAAESWNNFMYMQSLIHALNDEYKFRFSHEKNHKSYDKVQELYQIIGARTFDAIKATPHPQCMPEEFKVVYNPVEGYRNYYRGAKQHLHEWGKRGAPHWINL